MGVYWNEEDELTFCELIEVIEAIKGRTVFFRTDDFGMSSAFRKMHNSYFKKDNVEIITLDDSEGEEEFTPKFDLAQDKIKKIRLVELTEPYENEYNVFLDIISNSGNRLQIIREC